MRLLSGNVHSGCHSQSVCVRYRSIALCTCHLPYYLHGHCYGDRWIEKFSSPELVWTLIQVATCAEFPYALHIQRFSSVKATGLPACSFCFCSRVLRIEDGYALLCSALWRAGALWRSRFLLCFTECMSVEFSAHWESVVVACLFGRNWTCLAKQASA